MTFTKKLKQFLRKVIRLIEVIWRVLKNILRVDPRKRPLISIIVPFRADNPQREESFRWLRKYYDHFLPEAEVIVGFSRSHVFCKTEAFNNAVRRAKGKVIVLLDADAYIDTEVIRSCTEEILENLDNNLWFVPYKNLYRLTEHATQLVIDSDPKNPFRFTSPPAEEYIEHKDKATYGRRYGAMIMVMPREAIETLGCFDERFKGWGGEDVAILRALDTLYGKHKTTPNDLLHLWHPKIGNTYQTRMWEGQDRQMNNRLAMAYHKATNNPSMMRELVDEGCEYREKHSFVTWIISKFFGDD